MNDLDIIDIEKAALTNVKKGPVIIFEENPKRGGRIQIGISSLKKGEVIQWETHKYVTQFVKVESGEGYVQIQNGRRQKLQTGSSFVIRSHTPHIIGCTGKTLKLYSIYAKNSGKADWVH